MLKTPRLIRRGLSIATAIALIAGFAVSTSQAQTEPPKKDDAAQPKPAKISPRPAKKTGLETPEPTVVLKPGEVPAIKFDEPNYDFGRIRAGEDVTHTYYFTNTGNGPLEILRVKPSCGCTTAGEHTKVVQPGETGQIPIKLSTKKGGNTISKTVTVTTNIPGADGTIRLSIKGSVWQPVDVAPNNASFGRLTQSKVAEEGARRMTIVNNVEGTMTLTNIRCDNPHFKAQVKPIEDGKKYELIVELVPPLLEGNNRGLIQIDTGLKDYPTVEVAAFAFVTSPVDVTPSALTIIPDRTAATTRQFYVRSNDGKPFEITNLTSTSGKLGLSTTEMSGGKNTYQLAVEIPADFAPSGNETIEVETTHPAAPKLSIPVRSRGMAAHPRPMPGGHAVKASETTKRESTKENAKSPAGDMKESKPATKTDAEKKSEQKPGEMKPVG
ncbi:MAG: DUF1573 domain-containing protein [Phycisphaerales bacterium]|nr:DUF1573 domain-containing protein [Phycisphaerales bacterium]MCB9862375.1 DUF1573 domain-containing protein [Phycisphaerales bacterium]